MLRTLLVSALLLAATPASALTLTFSSDAAFLATTFTKDFGGNVRWGNAGASGDWEYSVVDGSDIPIGSAQQQYAWGGGANPHDVTFAYDDGTGVADLTLSVDPDVSSASVAVGGDGVNAIAIRARADLGDMATLDDITVTFDVDATSVNLGSLAGDGDAEYVVLIDSRLAFGFTLTADANLEDGSGSLPQYGFKVGNAVPEPGALALIAAPLALALIRRR